MQRHVYQINYRGTRYRGSKQKVIADLEAAAAEAERNKDYSAMHDILQHLDCFKRY